MTSVQRHFDVVCPLESILDFSIEIETVLLFTEFEKLRAVTMRLCNKNLSLYKTAVIRQDLGVNVNVKEVY